MFTQSKPSRFCLWLSSILLLSGTPASALEVGDPAPAFSHPEADGGTISLADQAGKVVLLNFWASWCGPCKEEIPEIETDIQQVYGPNSFTAISLNKFDDLETIGLYKHVLLGLDISYPFGHDEFGATSAAYEASSVLPYNYLIDHQGIVQYKEFGFSKAEIIAKIEELLEMSVQNTSWGTMKAAAGSR